MAGLIEWATGRNSEAQSPYRDWGQVAAALNVERIITKTKYGNDSAYPVGEHLTKYRPQDLDQANDFYRGLLVQLDAQIAEGELRFPVQQSLDIHKLEFRKRLARGLIATEISLNTDRWVPVQSEIVRPDSSGELLDIIVADGSSPWAMLSFDHKKAQEPSNRRRFEVGFDRQAGFTHVHELPLIPSLAEVAARLGCEPALVEPAYAPGKGLFYFRDKRKPGVILSEDTTFVTLPQINQVDRDEAIALPPGRFAAAARLRNRFRPQPKQDNSEV